MRIVFIGPPGAGKGTQALRLSRHLAVPHLSTGDMLRLVATEESGAGREVAGFLQTGRLVPDETVLRVLGERLAQRDAQRGCVLDGFPRTVAQAEALDGSLSRRGDAVGVVLNVVVPEEELLTRLAGRGRADDDREIVRARLEQFEALTQPLADYYRRQGLLEDINGLGTQDEVFARILAAVASHS